MTSRSRRIVTLVATVSAVAIASLAAVWVVQRRLVYLPDRTTPQAPASAEVGEFATDDGIRHVAWIFAPDRRPLASIVVFPGNAGNRAGRVPLAEALVSRGFEVILFDYRGYGGTAGSPSEAGLVSDAAAAVRFASERTDVPIVYFGESLGAAVAVAVAGHRPPAALVLRSPFASLLEVAREHYGPVPGPLLRDRWPVEDRIREVDVPVLVVAGTGDRIVPVDQSRRVAEAAGSAALLTIEAGHNDIELASGPELADAVAAFLADLPG